MITPWNKLPSIAKFLLRLACVIVSMALAMSVLQTTAGRVIGGTILALITACFLLWLFVRGSSLKPTPKPNEVIAGMNGVEPVREQEIANVCD